MKTLTPRRIGLTLIAALSVLTLSTCEDFFGTEDLKAIIKEDVATANADPVTFTISATPSSGGSLSLSGTQTKKVGESFIVTAFADDDYVFSNWTAEGSGIVEFSNPISETSRIVIKNSASDIIIKANFITRPYVKSVTPSEGNTVVKNQPIFINFNKAMLDTSFEEPGNIIVTYDTINPTIANPTTIYSSGTASDYFTSSVTSTRLALYPKSDSPASGDYMPSSSTITVYIDMNVKDTEENIMAGSKEWYFYTNDSTETAAPAISGITVRNGDSSAPIATLFTKDATNYYALKSPATALSISASTGSTSITVQGLVIIETGYTDGIGVTETTETGYSSTYEYTLKTEDEGPKQLEYYVKSSTGTESTHYSINVYLDSTPPTASFIGVASSSGTSFAKVGNTITLTYSAADDGGSTLATHSNNAIIAGHTVDATLSGSTYTATYTMTEDDNNGAVSYSIGATDKATNEYVSTLTTSSIVFDKTPPSFGSATLTVTDTSSGSTSVTNKDVTLTLSAAATDSNTVSGYAYYIGSAALTAEPASWTPITMSGSSTLVGTIPDISGSVSSGTAYVYICAYDSLGNYTAYGSCKSDTISVDTAGPSFGSATLAVTDTSSGSADATNKDVTLTLSAAATDSTAVSGYAYYVGSAALAAEPTWTAITMSAGSGSTLVGTIPDISGSVSSGTAYVYICAYDSLWNYTAYTGCKSDTISVDTAGPSFGSATLTVTDTSTGSADATNKDVTLTLSSAATDSTAVSGYAYYVGSAALAAEPTWTAITMSAGSGSTLVGTIPDISGSVSSGTAYLYLSAFDAAGNYIAYGSCKSDTISVDTAGPSFGSATLTVTDTSSGSVTVTNKDVTLTLSSAATDSTAVSGYAYYVGSATLAAEPTWTAITMSAGSGSTLVGTLADISGTVSSGTAYVYICAYDSLGNYTAYTDCKSDTITVDTATSASISSGSTTVVTARSLLAASSTSTSVSSVSSSTTSTATRRSSSSIVIPTAADLAIVPGSWIASTLMSSSDSSSSNAAVSTGSDTAQSKAPAIDEKAAEAATALEDIAIPVKATTSAKKDKTASATVNADSTIAVTATPVSYSPPSGTSSGGAPSDAPRAPDGTRSKAPFSVLLPANDDGRRRDEEDAPA